MSLDWKLMVVVIVGLILLAFVATLLMSREPRNRKLRFGFFIERIDHRSEEGEDE